jgi:hypothetical protein
MENSTELDSLNLTNPNMTEPLDCPQFSNETAAAIDTFAYWVEGVLLCSIAVPGIAGNALSSYILVIIMIGLLESHNNHFRYFKHGDSCITDRLIITIANRLLLH